MDSATFVMAAIALGISGILAAVKIWETFLSRSRFYVNCDWYEAKGTAPPLLHFTVANVGWRKDSIREIRLATADSLDDMGYLVRSDIMDKLPAALDVGEISEPFELHPPSVGGNEFQTALREGRVTKLIVVNSREQISTFPIPPIDFLTYTASAQTEMQTNG